MNEKGYLKIIAVVLSRKEFLMILQKRKLMSIQTFARFCIFHDFIFFEIKDNDISMIVRYKSQIETSSASIKCISRL